MTILNGGQHMSTNELPKIYFFTGAGISAESGVPTFRCGHDGLWNNYDIDEVCSITNFKRNHDMVNQFYREYFDMIQGVKPNAAHQHIGDLQKRYGGDRVKVITTNVDDLHERGGATDVLHVHGDIRYTILDFYGERKIVPVDSEYKVEPNQFNKPAVVFFGESARYTADGVKHPLYDEMYDMIDTIRGCDIVVVVGASFQVVPFDYILGACPAYKININVTDESHNGFFNSTLLDGATKGLQKCESFIEQTMEGKSV